MAYEGHNTTTAAQSEEERTRTNTFHLAPHENWKRVCLIELLDSAAALVNIVTYHRRQAYFDPERTRNNIWNAVTKTEIRNRFQPVLGRAITDKLLDKCDETWDAFFAQLDDYYNGDREDRPGVPGYWKEDGNRVLKRSSATTPIPSSGASGRGSSSRLVVN